MLLEFDRAVPAVADEAPARAPFLPPRGPSPADCSDLTGRADPAGCADLTGRRVLVLDDDPLAAVIATLDLEDAGAAFVLVHDEASAQGALDRAAAMNEPFDAAVLDVQLGGGRTSGPVADRLRAARVPFVLHTAEPGALPEGAAPVVSKPAMPGALGAALSREMSREMKSKR